MKRDLVSIDDLSDGEIRGLLDLAAACERAPAPELQGSILATLFLEPSTRTRLSFEAAMHRLGGDVITSADPQTSSATKGESLSDTVRMVDGYADVIVLRHAAAGAARAAARVARAPVLNAGDGGHEHPSQTLVDLFTLVREVGRLEGLSVVLYGDLLHGRTAHSLVLALGRFGATVLALAEPGLDLPEYVLARLRARGARIEPAPRHELADLMPQGVGPGVRIVAAGAASGAARMDAVYATRLQRERLAGPRAGAALPPVDPRFLAHPALASAIVMHPLPRTSEIDPRIDDDPRAAYFRQASFGVPVRMALLAWALGRRDLGARPAAVRTPASAPPGVRCSAAACIAAREAPTTPPDFVAAADGVVRCGYCEAPLGGG